MKSSQQKPKCEHIHHTKKRAEASHLLDHNKRKYNRSSESFINKKRKVYPVLIVETLPKTFGKIDKINTKKQPNISKEEAILLNLIARIIVEIFIKEEL